MASENETVEDIVKEKRDTADEAELKGKNTFSFDLAKMLREEADRIETAHQREVAELRECLKEAMDEKCRSCKAEWYGQCVTKDGGDCELIAKWRKALEGAKDEGK